MNQDVKALEEALQAGPTPGEWYVDSTRSEGEYGDGGPDGRSGFDAFALFNEAGHALLDTLNRDTRLSEITEEADEYEGHFRAWDVLGERDLKYIATCSPDRIRRLLDYIRKLEQEVANGK